MDNYKKDVLDFIDAFNNEVAMFRDLEFEFFQEREEISKALAQNQVESPLALGNKKQEAYNTMLGYGFDLLLHGLNYKEYQDLMKQKLVKVDEDFLLQLKSLSLITNEKMERYRMMKNGLKESLGV